MNDSDAAATLAYVVGLLKEYADVIAAVAAISGLATAILKRWPAALKRWISHVHQPAATVQAYGVRRPDFSTLIGRDYELEELQRFVESEEPICIVYGLGGCGKTALVTAFADSLARKKPGPFKTIVYVTADDGAGDIAAVIAQIQRSVAVLLSKPELVRLQEYDWQQVRHVIGTYLDAVGPTLLVIDNWDRIPLARVPTQLFEFGRHTRLIVTTRSDEATSHTRVRVGELSPGAALQLAQQCAERFLAGQRAGLEANLDSLLAQAATACGQNALALRLVVPAICEASIEGAGDRVPKLVSSMRVAHTDLATHVARFTCERLAGDSGAILPLRVLALLPVSLSAPELKDLCRAIDSAIEPNFGRLIRSSVVEVHGTLTDSEAPLHSVHPLVGEYVRRTLAESPTERQILAGAGRYYLEVLRGSVGSPRLRPPAIKQYRLVERHIAAVLLLVDEMINLDRASALALISGLGYFFRVREYWPEADKYWALAFRMATENEGPDSENAVRFLLYLAYMDVFRGRYSGLSSRVSVLFDMLLERLPTVRRILATTADSLDSHDAEYIYNSASILRLVGLTEREAGNYTSAWRFLTQAHAVMRAVKSFPGIARTANDLADLVMGVRKDEARDLLCEACDCASHAGDWIETARSWRLMGDLSRATGETSRALVHYRKAETLLEELGLPDERFCVRHGLRSLGAQPRATRFGGAAIDRATLDNAEGLAAWLDARPRVLTGDVVRCVVMDWSGVVCNDLEVTRECQMRIIEKYTGRALTPSEWQLLATTDWRSMFADLLPPVARADAQEMYRSGISDAAAVARMSVSEGVGTVLRRLKRQGYMIALYSGQVPEPIQAVIDREGLRCLFDFILCDPVPGKPHRTHIAAIGAALQVEPTEMVLVDDMPGPLEMAAEERILAIRVGSTVTGDSMNTSNAAHSLMDVERRIDAIDSCRQRLKRFYEQRYLRKRLGLLQRVALIRSADTLAYLQITLKHLRPAPQVHLLDVGAGVSIHTLGENCHIWRADLAQGALRHAPAGAVVASGVALPFGDSSMDAVICIETLEHMCPGDDAESVREMARVLRPGGVVVLSVPCAPASMSAPLWRIDRLFSDVGHLREYDRQAIQRLIGASGLRLVKMKSAGYFLLGLLLSLERSERLYKIVGVGFMSDGITNGIERCLARAIRAENAALAMALTGFRTTVIATKD